MADPLDSSTLGSADITKQAKAHIPKSRSTENEDKYLSYSEISSLASTKSGVRKPVVPADRQQLLDSVSKQFSTYQISPAQASQPALCLTRDAQSGDSPSKVRPIVEDTVVDLPSSSDLAAMPYNNTAIPPPEEVTGSAALPLARVKRILQLDEDISACSANGAFAITVATEMFIRYLAEQSLNVVKSERKPRRNIQYRDVANAVARIDNLEFLSDVVPKTMTYREFKQQKAARAVRKQEMLQAGQTTIDGSIPAPEAAADTMDADDRNPDEQLEVAEANVNGHEPRGSQSTTSPHPNGNGNIIFQHYQPNGDSHADESKDMEMD